MIIILVMVAVVVAMAEATSKNLTARGKDIL